MVDKFIDKEDSLVIIKTEVEKELNDTLILSEEYSFNTNQTGTICTKQVINIKQ